MSKKYKVHGEATKEIMKVAAEVLRIYKKLTPYQLFALTQQKMGMALHMAIFESSLLRASDINVVKTDDGTAICYTPGMVTRDPIFMNQITEARQFKPAKGHVPAWRKNKARSGGRLRRFA